ncbi:MAG: cytochrome P450 [bacterium]|nr:cytochrome P450 [bacterium]
MAAPPADQPPDLVYDPYDYAIHEDPYPTYARLREEAPVYHNAARGFWALSRFHDVLAALQDWETYSSVGGVALEKGSGQAPPMIIAMDPPRQLKLRRLVSKVFTPRRIAELEPRVRALTLKHLGPLLARGEGDVLAEFAAKLPMDVISTMLGVPDEDQDTLRGWSDALLHREAGQGEVTAAGQEGARGIVGYFMRDIAKKRANPGDDLISALLAAEVDGERLADDEVLGFCFLLVIAGNETTTKMLGNALVLLDRHPEQKAVAVGDPAAMAGVVEEVLRYDNSTQMLARSVTREVTLHDRTIPAGSRILVLIGAGNRDPRAFAHPDRFDVRRKPEQILHFGNGIHVCLGAALARLEGRVALEEVHRRMPDYVVDRAGLVRVHSANVRGYAAVPVRFTPGR